MQSLRNRLASVALLAAASLPWAAHAQDLDKLPNYVPVLPAVKARALDVDPKKGFLVKEVKPNIYVVTDGLYQSAFVTTGSGVVLFDAPPSFADKLPAAVTEVTQEPIRQIVYSHAHLDHIAGAEELSKKINGLQILAEEDTARFLREKNEPVGRFPRARSRTGRCSSWVR